MEFNLKEWNHEYLGWIGLIVSIFYFSWWIFIPSLILTLDGFYQLYAGQHKGLFHMKWISWIYQIPIIKKFNIWIDKVSNVKVVK